MRRLLILCLVLPTCVTAGEVSSWTLLAREMVVGSTDLNVSLDLSAVYEAGNSPDDPFLRDWNYSAVGWDLDEDGSDATARLTAEIGHLVEGRFVTDGQTPVVVAENLTGRGTVDWRSDEGREGVYRLKHEVLRNGVPDGSCALYGYVSFMSSEYEEPAEYAVLRKSAFAEVTHDMVLVSDSTRPWRPIDDQIAGSGIEYRAYRQSPVTTQTSFDIWGAGRFSYEVNVEGGRVDIVLDGTNAVSHQETGNSWRHGALDISAARPHRVVFSFVGEKGYCVAGLRNVRWQELRNDAAAAAERPLRLDVCDGVRAVKHFEDVLPFAYSSTNWIGGVSDATAASAARVTVVQLTGTDPAVTNWTDTVPGTACELYCAPGEGSVQWKVKTKDRGVWKASFEILGTDHREDAIFDLRKTCGAGFLLMIF